MQLESFQDATSVSRFWRKFNVTSPEFTKQLCGIIGKEEDFRSFNTAYVLGISDVKCFCVPPRSHVDQQATHVYYVIPVRPNNLGSIVVSRFAVKSTSCRACIQHSTHLLNEAGQLMVERRGRMQAVVSSH